MNDAEGPESLFLVVSHDFNIVGDKAPYFCSILQLDMENEDIEPRFSFHFRQPEPQPRLILPISWAFSLESFTNDLYMVPTWQSFSVLPRCDSGNIPPLHGCIFNLSTNKCKRIKNPHPSKHVGHVVTLGGHVYSVAHPRRNRPPEPLLESYNHLAESWEARQQFPRHLAELREAQREFPRHTIILATAVWDDTILLNLGGCEIWAYNVAMNQWYPVEVDHELCYCIQGEAVVLGNTIYALKGEEFNVVLALSVEREETDGVLFFKCYLVSEILVAGTDDFEVVDKDEDEHWYNFDAEGEDEYWFPRTTHLVYLGKDKFCLVRCFYQTHPTEFQYLVLNCIELDRENSIMTVINTRVRKLQVAGRKQFNVRCCFTLPKCKTTALEEGKGTVLKFNPFSKQLAATIPLSIRRDYAEEETGEGRSIYVKNWKRNSSVEPLVNALYEFGPMKTEMVKVRTTKNGKCFVIVEFKSVASKQRAIEASPLMIGTHLVEIEERRITEDLTSLGSLARMIC